MPRPLADAVPPEGAPAPPGPPPLRLVRRFTGVLLSPRDTFASVVAQPRFLGMLLVITLGTAAAMVGFLSMPAGREAWVNTTIERVEQSGRRIGDRDIEALEKMAPLMSLVGAAVTLISTPLRCLILAGILFGAFEVLVGRAVSFKQVFAVVVHAGVLVLVQEILSAPLKVVRGSTTSVTTLGVFLPMLEPASYAARLLGLIDVFHLWSILLLAIGLSVLYQRRTGPIAAALFAVYVLILAVVAMFAGLEGA